MNTTAVLTKISALATGVASLTLAWAGSALAITLTFDDLPDITTPIGTELTAPIPNSSGGYGGLGWRNFFYLDAENYFANPSGFENGIQSGPNVAFNGRGQEAEILITDPLIFNSVYLTSAWNNDLNVVIKGFSGNKFLIGRTITLGVTDPTLFTFDWAGIDRLSFSSYGGTNAGFNGEGTQFVMDDFTFTRPSSPSPPPIPTPALLPGLLGMGVAAWRRHQAEGQTTEDPSTEDEDS